jgi:hypothetical protein
MMVCCWAAFFGGRRCTGCYFYRGKEEREMKRGTEAYQEKRNFSFDALMHQICYSFIARGRTRGLPPKKSAMLRFSVNAKQSW